jgi:hypothetical protein
MSTMKTFPALVALCVVVALSSASGCSKQETASTTSGGVTATAATVPKIPILPGYKYYIGGPSLKRDPYGRYRVHDFNTPVEQPPSRGMIFGVKIDADKLEYRVWGNGKLLAVHRGIMRDGLYWPEYAESYRDEKLVARENTVNDDSIKRSKQTTEDVDPETGEVIRTKEASISYYPPAKLPDDDDDSKPDETAPPKGPDSVTSEPLEGEMQRVPPTPAAPAAPAEPKNP